MTVEGVVTLNFHIIGKHHQLRHRRQKDRCGFPTFTGSHKTTNRLCEEERCAGAGSIHTHRQAGYVHPFGYHAYRDHPPLVAFTKIVDFSGCFTIVRKYYGRLLSRDLVQFFGVGFGVGMVSCDDERSRVGNSAAHFGESFIGRREHGGNPLTLRIKCGAPCLGGNIFSESFP